MDDPVIKACRALRPGEIFGFRKDASGIQRIHVDYVYWPNPDTVPPTKQEILDELARQESEKYKEQRAPEYPPLSELADAIFWQSKGDNSKMEAYMAAVEAVKEKYPKGDHQ